MSGPAAAAELDALASTGPADVPRQWLADLHAVLIRAVAADDDLPEELLRRAGELAGPVDADVVESLPNRARIALRLLRSGAWAPARLVLADNAVGVVDAAFAASTSSGAVRTGWRLPVLTVIESGTVYADLPGFRDPRFGVPDACYDISAAIRLRVHVDEAIVGARLRFAGWAALDVLRSAEGESVRVVASHADDEVGWPATRHRRGDLVGGLGEGLRRRVWAGWSASVDAEALVHRSGAWTLELELDHDGVVRRTRLGTSVGELAARLVGQTLRSGSPRVRLDARKGGWAFIVTR